MTTDSKDLLPAAAKPKRRPPAAGIGRKKGTPNKTTAVLKEAILLAAEQVGENGRGKDGLVGYIKRVARKDTKAMAALLGKVLPLQVVGDPEHPLHHVAMTLDEFRRAAAEVAAKV